MKKLILFLLFISTLSFAQTTVRMSATATGTNTYSTTFNPTVSTFNSSTIYVIPFTNANTSGTITVDPDGAGVGSAISIKGDDGNDLAVGAIKAGGTYSFKFNGTLLRMIGTYTNSGGWAVTGTTSVNAPTIDAGSTSLLMTGTPGTTFFLHGSTDQIGMASGSGSTIMLDPSEIRIDGNTNIVINNGAGGLNLSAAATVIGGEDVNINGGLSGSGKDINLTATNGHVHLSGAAGILLDPTGPITINTDPGTAGDVLQSNGAGAAPTWVAPSGGGGVNTFAPNIQTGNYTAVIGDTIQVIYMRNVSTPQTLTIPLNVFPVGSFITVVQDTTAVTTVAGAAGVDIVGRLTLTQKESAVFHQRSSNTWVRLGGEEGVWTTWTPTFTGFSVDPTVSASYRIEGKKLFIHMTTTANGTSNATTFTITNLPVAPVYQTIRLCYITNNNVPAAGRYVITAGSTTMTFSATPAAGAFTASGGKGAGFEAVLEID